MTAADLCTSLGITRRKLNTWIQRGLPHGRKGRAYNFDPAAVEAWLVAAGLAAAPRIETTQDAASAALGVNRRTLREWLANGAPGRPGHYDVDAIAKWRDGRDDPGSGDPLLSGSSPELERYRGFRADLAALDLEARRGNLVPRAEIHQIMDAIAETLRRCGERLEKNFGSEARELLDETIDSCKRHLEQLEIEN